MELNSTQVLPVDQAKAWAALNDVELLRSAIPGCETITATGENEYEVHVTAAVGPVKARFKGKLRLADIVPPVSYTLHFEGQGGAAGHGKGQAAIRLEAQGAAGTLLHYTAKASVGGRLAQVGSRLVDMAAQKMAGEFFAAFSARLVERYGVPVPAAAAARPGVLARLLAWLRGLFGAGTGEGPAR
ncbi:MAG: carbon monoxide dehydrogenase subunit G [Burkholderiales bacterium]|nr:carbon monoxide dehydrogenase subunit G [Burkholderiales bacterium]